MTLVIYYANVYLFMEKQKTSSIEHPHRQTFTEFEEAVREVKGPYVHVLMFKFRDEASKEEIDTSIEMAKKLGELPGIVGWNIQESIDQRKGRTVIELGVFESGQAFLDFRDHPVHQEFATYVRDYADWNIVDFESTVSSHESHVQKMGALGLLGTGIDKPHVE